MLTSAKSQQKPGKAAANPVRRRRRVIDGKDAARATPLSSESIIQVGFELARETPLQEVSIAMVAKKLDISPGLVHYYIGTRERLTSGIMNLFYQKMYAALPEASGDWEKTLTETANTMYNLWIEVPGITSYVVGNNTFKTYQIVDGDNLDYGLEVNERLSTLVKRAGASKKKTGIFARLIKDFSVSAALSHITHAYPSQHRDLIATRTSNIVRARYPGLFFCRDSLLTTDAKEVFDIGLHSLLLGLKDDAPFME